MGCLYDANWGEETCQMFDDDRDDNGQFKTDPVGWTRDGHCVVEDDECPADSCQYYESDEDPEEEE